MKKALQKAWELVAMSAVSGALAFILMQAFVVPDRLRANAAAAAAVAAAVLVLLTLLFYNRRSTHVTLAVTAAGLALAVVYVCFFSRGLRRWNINLLIPVLFYLIAGGAALAVFLLSRTRAGLAALFAGGAGVGCVMRLIGYTVNTAAYLVMLAGTLLLFLSRQFEVSAKHFPHVDVARRHAAAVAAGITALAVAGSLLACSLTGRITPLRLTADRNQLTAWLQGRSAKAGYSGSGQVFGGPVKPDSTPVMDVRTDGPFYLKGTSFSTYTGHGWERGKISASDQMAVMYDNRLAAPLWMPGYLYASDSDAFRSLPPLNSVQQMQYYRSHNTAVTPQDMTVTLRASTYNLFLPEGYVDTRLHDAIMAPTKGLRFCTPFLFVDGIAGEFAVPLQNQATNDFDAGSTLGVGTAYTVTAPRYDMDSGVFQSAANAESSDFTAMLSAMAGYYHDAQLVSSLREYYGGSLREQYSRPDAAVTARTKELAQMITRSCRTDTDKVAAIRNYLAQHCSYTLSPKQGPKGRDFVDYFLFSGKKGYCVHFASAMTVLLRCAGVPARYAEGYVSPADSDEDGVYHVTHDQAHAWVEVYSSLLGWYPVEATPGFPDTDAAGGTTSSAVSSAVSSQASSAAVSQADASSAVSSAASSPSGGKKAGRMNMRPLLIAVPAGLAALFLLGAAARAAFARLRLRLLRRRPAKEQVERLYAGFLRAFRRLGRARRPEETPEEFARRVGGAFSGTGSDWEEVTRLFCRVRYGGEEPDKADLACIWRYAREFPRLCRRRAGWRRCLLAGIF